MKTDNYEYSEKYEKEITELSDRLNFSDTKIIAKFNQKVTDYKRQHRVKKVMTRVLSIAAAIVVAVGSVAVYNGYIEKDSAVGIQEETQNVFNVKVYAADNDGASVVLEDGVSVEIQDTIDITYKSIKSDGEAVMIGRLPLICEGNDIESVTYKFEDGETGFWQDYILDKEEESEFVSLISDDEITLDTDLFAVGDKHDQLLYFLKKRNLLGSYSNKPAEDGRYHLTQMVGNSITVNYDEQKDKIMYIESRWLGDKALQQNAFYLEDEMLKGMSEYVNGRVLTVTARMNNGSIAVKKLGLRSELYQSLDDTNMKIYIYTIQN